MQTASRNIRHKAIRTALKSAFPATRFAVRGSRGTGYGWTNVGWTDGPTDQAVSNVVRRFFGSKFNGMTDGYDPTGNNFEHNGEWYRAGGDGFHTHRAYSPAFMHRVVEAVGTRYGAPPESWPAVVPSEHGTHLEARADTTSPLSNGDDYHNSWRHLVWRAMEDRTTVSA